MYVYCIQKETMYGTYTRDHIGKCSLTFRKPLSSQFGWTEHHKWLGTCTHSLTGEQDGISTFMVSKECAHNSPNRTRHIEPCSYQQLQQSDTSTDTTSCVTVHISKCSYLQQSDTSTDTTSCVTVHISKCSYLQQSDTSTDTHSYSVN